MKSSSLKRYLLALPLTFTLSSAVTLDEPSQLETTTYDYVIVGAGTAGLALANRLSEDASTTVLVLEAGVSDDNVVPVMAPFLGPTVTPNTPWDWNYTVTPQSGLDGRTFPYPRGRILGGSSSANYMIHQYGTNENWEKMAAVAKDEGWSWENMKKYIERHENFIVDPLDGHNTTAQFTPSLHSFSGILDVSLYVATQDIDGRVITTTQQLEEFPYNEDISGIDNDLLGVGWAQSSMSNGVRASSSTSYLAKANARPNLTVLINAMVTKLVPTGASGKLKAFRQVEYVDARTGEVGTTFQVHARKEVILSAGSIGTPQILQLSGIGALEDLTPHGIPVLVENHHVGRNLQDHPLLPNVFTVRENMSMDHILRNPVAVEAGITQWATSRSGFITNNVINNLGFQRVKTSDLGRLPDPSAGPHTPHFEMVFANYWLDPVTPVPATGSYLTILTAVLTPTSRGSVKIRSTNPFDAPLINPNMLATKSDILIMREAIKAIKRFAAAPAWSDYITGLVGKFWSSADADLDAHARQHTTTVFHPTSTASMTSYASKDGVVNPDLTVKGTEGLRIVDLSVLPFIPSCHPQGSAYLVAERAADLIRSREHSLDYFDPLTLQVVIT